MAQERISVLDKMTTETSRSEKQREKNRNRIFMTCGTITRCDIYAMGILEGKEEEQKQKLKH
jgi:hypothetical protein